MSRRTLLTILATLLVAGFLAGAGALAFIYSGIYPIAASQPHARITRWLLTTTMVRSVKRYASDVHAPRLDDAALVRRGFVLYRQECELCHGGPGVAAQQAGRGINPDPPRLDKAGAKWSDGEVYWIIANGLKMSGMPAMEAGKTPRDLWALVAFVRRMAWLSPQEYARMAAAVSGDTAAAAALAWLPRGDFGFAAMRRGGSTRRGKQWIELYACGACHVIPGIPLASGQAGPPLTDFAARHYLAGELINTPDNLVAWLLNPQAVEPKTAMPRVGLTSAQALDVAAYLYTLGEATQLEPPFPPRP
ncbi:MAG TPA: c-type cytochrome [Longimicrobiales bacterium]